MRARSLAPFTLALAALLPLVGARTSLPATNTEPLAVSTAAPGNALAADHSLVVDAPALEVNGDALSDVTSVETLGASREECCETSPSLTPRRARAMPERSGSLAALGRRAHPPTAPPRSA